MKELTNIVGKYPLFKFPSEIPLISVEQKLSDLFYTHTQNLQKKYSINHVLSTYYIKLSYEAKTPKPWKVWNEERDIV